MNIARVLYIQVLLTALGLCVIWQDTLVRQEGYRLERVGRDIENARTEVQKYKAQISKLRSPQRIVTLVRRLGLEVEQAPAAQDAGADLSEGPQDGDSYEPVQTAKRTP